MNMDEDNHFWLASALVALITLTIVGTALAISYRVGYRTGRDEERRGIVEDWRAF